MRTPIALLALLSLGCSTKHPGTYEVAAATAPADTATALREHGQTLWEMRADKAKLTDALTKFEQASAADPTDRATLVHLTRGWYFLGDAYETDMPQKLAAWEKAIGYGKQCIALNTEFTALMEKGDEKEASAIRVAKVEDVPCVYWMATALGKWAKESGLAKTLKHIGTVKAYITKVEELDPTYFYGATDRYWGAYYAAIPSFAGQDLDKSKTHFDKAVQTEPNYLATRVLLAEFWAVKTQDKAVFEENLEYVIAAADDVIPEITAENKAEKAKAETLLARKDDLFAD